MNFQDPLGWDLPAGCSAQDIDRAHGGGPHERALEIALERWRCPECDGKLVESAEPGGILRCVNSTCEGGVPLSSVINSLARDELDEQDEAEQRDEDI